MRALDGLNQRYGHGTVAMASAGVAGARRNGVMKQERNTPQLHDLLEEHAGGSDLIADGVIPVDRRPKTAKTEMTVQTLKPLFA